MKNANVEPINLYNGYTPIKMGLKQNKGKTKLLGGVMLNMRAAAFCHPLLKGKTRRGQRGHKAGVAPPLKTIPMELQKMEPTDLPQPCRLQMEETQLINGGGPSLYL